MSVDDDDTVRLSTVFQQCCMGWVQELENLTDLSRCGKLPRDVLILRNSIGSFQISETIVILRTMTMAIKILFVALDPL